MNESITVSALNRYVKIVLESDEVLSQVWVEGEIVGFHMHHQSGHAYFSISEGGSSVRCVMFRDKASRVRFSVEDGMYVVLRCRVSLYERDGTFQLYVDDILPKGEGASKRGLEELKNTLEAEGLFSQERKRLLPRFPRKIAVITSSSGAALQDIINVTHRRNPTTKLELFPVTVQGINAAVTICSAIRRVNARCEDFDLAIIARGGGSAEDLSCFNIESVVRSAAGLKIPFISAVGHETDWTLLDYAADRRAPTPSAAAEIAVPDVDSVIDTMRGKLYEIRSLVLSYIDCAADNCSSCKKEIKSAVNEIVDTAAKRHLTSSDLIAAMNPLLILKRGYAIAFNGDGESISSIKNTSAGDAVNIQLSDGILNCTVNSVDMQTGRLLGITLGEDKNG